MNIIAICAILAISLTVWSPEPDACCGDGKLRPPVSGPEWPPPIGSETAGIGVTPPALGRCTPGMAGPWSSVSPPSAYKGTVGIGASVFWFPAPATEGICPEGNPRRSYLICEAVAKSCGDALVRASALGVLGNQSGLNLL